MSRADVSGNQNDDTAKILKEDYPEMEYIDCPIKNRKVFRNTVAQGLGVVEFKPKDPKAIEELENLYKFVFKEDYKGGQ